MPRRCNRGKHVRGDGGMEGWGEGVHKRTIIGSRGHPPYNSLKQTERSGKLHVLPRAKLQLRQLGGAPSGEQVATRTDDLLMDSTKRRNVLSDVTQMSHATGGDYGSNPMNTSAARTTYQEQGQATERMENYTAPDYNITKTNFHSPQTTTSPSSHQIPLPRPPSFPSFLPT